MKSFSLFNLLIISMLCIDLSGQSNEVSSAITIDSLESLAANFDEIVIAENRLKIPFSDNSRSINIISKAEIQALRVTSINELLQVVGGVDIRQRGIGGVQADISIRGGTFEQTLILLNGVRLLDAQTGHHMMNIPVPVESIERIEVIKGPAARIYGQNAFAGAVNIVTKLSEKPNITIGADYGEHSLTNIYASGSVSLGDYNQTLSGSYNASDGYRYNTDYEIANVFYQSELDLGKSKLSFFGGHVDRKFGANSFYGRETFTEQYEEVQTSLASLGYETRVGEWQISPRVSWRRNKDNWQFNRQDPELFQNFHTTNAYSAELQSSRSHTLGILGVGVEYNNLHLDSSNLKDSIDNGMHTRNQISLHLENRFLFLDEKLDVTPGLLVSKVTDYDIQFFPGLDIGYALSQRVKLFSNVGLTTRIPTFTDLYYKDSGSVGNAALTEERAFTAELGVKLVDRHYNVQASYFVRNATDQIDWFRVNEADKWMPDNFNVATYRGLDISGTYLFRDMALGKYIKSTRVAYTYIDAAFEDNDFAFSRNQLENLKHQVVISPQFTIGPLDLTLLWKYYDRVTLEDYSILDANVSININQYTFYIKANNLLDTQYRESSLVDMPGRWVLGGVRFSFL